MGVRQDAASVALDFLACRRGGRLLFCGLSLTLAAGDALMVEGPNGVGKSSLLRAIAGLLRPFVGSVAITGKVALADDRDALDREHPLAGALGFWAKVDGAAAGAVGEALDRLALGNLAQVPVAMLSTGQRRRAAFARVLVSGADIWLLDEPANALDGDSLARLGDMINVHRTRGGIVIAAAHGALPIREAATLDLARLVPG